MVGLNEPFFYPPPAALTLDDIAGELRCSKRHAATMRALGRLPEPIEGLRPLLRWRRDEIHAWIAAGCPARDRWEARP